MNKLLFFPLNGIVLALYSKQALADDIKVSPAGNGFTGITLAYNVKSPEEVDEVLKMVEKLGAQIIKQSEKVFWGGYSGYFGDQDGYLWEVAYNPYFDFDENESLFLP